MINNRGYSADEFQAFAVDVWDGNDLNAAIFIANSQITYPFLMYGGINGIMSDYNCSYDIGVRHRRRRDHHLPRLLQ